ncbi:MAG TPA: 3-oxoacid CoA-transferase subunit B [Dehalococcoidia bacterium]|nr:3-oxoacid CoA-transferase subunit B [Dehalococcoidia bacterium]
MPQGLTRELIAMRVARELSDGMYVNLGIGLPTLVASFIDPGVQVIFQAENGILGYGGILERDFDQDLINAGGQPVSILPGACFFGSDTSFAMIRGGHVDVAVLGGLQVSEQGDLANWIVPERGGGSIGGAMDLAAGARRLIIAMEHATPRGEPKVLRRCSYPLTAQRCVDLIVTDLAVVEVTSEGLLLRELAPGVSAAEVEALTDAPLHRAPDLREMSL